MAGTLKCYLVATQTDPRWPSFVERHPASSIFHSRAWLGALELTYGFEAAAVTTSPPGEELANAIVFCRVRSGLTGNRLVSLPFSDHCQPLVDAPESLQLLLASLGEIGERGKWKFVELRPLDPLLSTGAFSPSRKFCFHLLDLRPSLDTIRSWLHKDCVVRKIRRAERDGVTCEEGRSGPLLHKFYALQLQTRRRHRLPPQPFSWFRNLAGCLGDRMTVRVASVGERPIAAIVTLRHRNTVTFKYGCSDERYSRHGGTQLLFWRMIEEAKSQGVEWLDMGRSDCDQHGLIDFKSRWGAASSVLTYLRYPADGQLGGAGCKEHLAGRIVSLLPDAAFSLAGRLLYRHLG